MAALQRFEQSHIRPLPLTIICIVEAVAMGRFASMLLVMNSAVVYAGSSTLFSLPDTIVLSVVCVISWLELDALWRMRTRGVGIAVLLFAMTAMWRLCLGLAIWPLIWAPMAGALVIKCLYYPRMAEAAARRLPIVASSYHYC